MKTNIYYPSAKEQVMCKLGSIITVNSGRDYKHLDNGNIPVFGTGGIIGFVSKDLYKGDAIGIGRKGTINKPFILKGPFWTVDTLFWCTINDSNSIEYVFQLVKTIDFKKYDEGSTLPSLSSQNIKNISVRVHDVADQVRIGNLLASIDNLISNQDRKNTAIKNNRYYLSDYLINVLPIPKTKFQLKSLFQVDNNGVDKKIKLGEQQVNLLNYMDVYKSKIYTDMVVSATDKQIIDCSVKKSDIYITPSSETPQDIMNAFYVDRDLENYCYSYHICRLRRKNDNIIPQYVTFMLNSNLYRKKFAKLATGATRFTLSKANIEEFILDIPCVNNQRKVATVLSSMDKLIELEENKLEKLELMKKYYLQQIFD